MLAAHVRADLGGRFATGAGLRRGLGRLFRGRPFGGRPFGGRLTGRLPAAPAGCSSSLAAAPSAPAPSPAPAAARATAPSVAGTPLPWRWVYQNHTPPAMVPAIATNMFSRRPRKCSDGSTRSDSSKMRNAEYPVTYSANSPGALMPRWWPSHTRAAASARSKISSYRNVGWKVWKPR